MLGSISGLRMTESHHALEEDGKRGAYVKRSLKERLFSRPWKPFRKDKLILIRNYKPIMFVMGNRFIFHPSLKDHINAALEKE